MKVYSFSVPNFYVKTLVFFPATVLKAGNSITFIVFAFFRLPFFVLKGNKISVTPVAGCVPWSVSRDVGFFSTVTPFFIHSVLIRTEQSFFSGTSRRQNSESNSFIVCSLLPLFSVEDKMIA